MYFPTDGLRMEANNNDDDDTTSHAEVELDATGVTLVSVIGQVGAVIGGGTLGYISTFFGRRLTMMMACVCGGAILPAYVLPHSLKLVASAFFLQFFVGGVWGPIPIHLTELSPPALRATMVGLTYQLGNLASSASATIQAVIGERYPLAPLASGVARYDYGKVIGIFMGAVWVYDLVFLFIGPEMTEQERAEFAAQTDEYERLRKAGVSLAEIGAEKAKRAALEGQQGGGGRVNDDDVRVGEKPTDIEHIEASPYNTTEAVRKA